MEPDVDWVQDGTRFMGSNEERERNNKHLKKMFEDYGFRYIIISGSYEERFIKARALVDEMMEE
jgi:nicotinamide riboside kinase